MGYSKVIAVGDAGSVSITEEGGVASVKVSLAQSVGGGSVAGVAKAQLSAEIDLSAIQLINAGLDLLAAKFPSAAAIVEGAKAIVDAEAANV